MLKLKNIVMMLGLLGVPAFGMTMPFRDSSVDTRLNQEKSADPTELESKKQQLRRQREAFLSRLEKGHVSGLNITQKAAQIIEEDANPNKSNKPLKRSLSSEEDVSEQKKFKYYFSHHKSTGEKSIYFTNEMNQGIILFMNDLNCSSKFTDSRGIIWSNEQLKLEKFVDLICKQKVFVSDSNNPDFIYTHINFENDTFRIYKNKEKSASAQNFQVFLETNTLKFTASFSHNGIKYNVPIYTIDSQNKTEIYIEK